MSGSTAKSDRKKVQRAIGTMASEALVNHTIAINSLILTVNALMVRVETLEAKAKAGAIENFIGSPRPVDWLGTAVPVERRQGQ